MAARVNIKYLIGAVGIWLLGGALYGAPAGPDAVPGWLPIVGAFAYFCFFLLAAFSLGALLTRYLTGPAGIGASLALGLGGYALLGECLGVLGGLSFAPNPLLLAALLVPVAVYAVIPGRPGMKWRWPAGPCALLLFLALFFFALSWIPDSMPDPLWYDLTAARWWMSAGSYRKAQVVTAFFQSGAWDALLLWGNFLLGAPGEGGLIAAQFFGQWLHLLAAGGLVAWGLWRISIAYFPELTDEARGFLVLLSLLSISQLRTLPTAKNDWGAAAFAFAGIVWWLEARSRRSWVPAGILLGLALSTKSSALFALGALVPLSWKLKRPSAAEAALLLLSALGACLPWLFRNYVALGDPFFPALQAYFPASSGPSWRRFTSLYEGRGLSLAGKSWLLRDLVLDTPFFTLLPLGAAGLIAPAFRKRWAREGAFCALVLAALALFFFKAGIRAEYRLFGAGCFLVVLAPAGLAFTFLDRNGPSLRRRRAFYLGGCCLAVGWLTYFAPFPWRAPLLAMQQASPTEEIRAHFGGTVQSWIRLNLPAEARIASANEFRLYYLSGRKAFRIWDVPALDEQLTRARSTAEIIDVLRREKIDYLIFTRMDWDVFYRQEVLDALENAWGVHREAVVFGNEHSKLIDLRILAAALAK